MKRWFTFIFSLLALVAFARAPAPRFFLATDLDRLANFNNGANAFFYDLENRLINTTVGGTSVSYTYNADGIRVSKTTGGATTLYLVDDRNPTGFAQVLEELAVSGGTTNLTKVRTSSRSAS